METHETKRERTVLFGKFKTFAHDRLPAGPLRDLILSEPDELPASELAVKMSMYLKLLRRPDHGSGDC